jgi:hypothetical protein
MFNVICNGSAGEGANGICYKGALNYGTSDSIEIFEDV